MPARDIPGLNLRAYWALGEAGWKTGMDENMWRLSFMVQARVLGIVEELPISPENGDRYILVDSGSPFNNHMAVWDVDIWAYIAPEHGFIIYNGENNHMLRYNETPGQWVELISPEAIKELYESNDDTNAFTNAEKNKLADIENDATADMSAAEIKAAYESNLNTNAFTDAEKAKLAGLSSSRFLGVYPTLGSLQSAHPAPPEGSFGYVDGGPLLDILCYIWDANSVKYVLQASAGGMETPETIKTKYESNEDTNAFTDAEKEKLALFDPDEPGPEGRAGKSAYEVAVENGFVGDEITWLASLVGPQGNDGTDGIDGTDGVDGTDGNDGLSAYQIALNNGFVGAEAVWLASLVGAPGTDGSDGADGEDGSAGNDGASAYEVAVANGFVGDQVAWLASLQGAPGTNGANGVDGTDGVDGVDGNDGASAYDIAVANGFVGNEVEWLASLKIEGLIVAASDLTTAITTGTHKEILRLPYAFTVVEVRASLATPQATGSIVTVDIIENGASILSTKLSIDNSEKTSVTAATSAIISKSNLADDAEITISITQVGDGTAKGLKVVLIGYRT